MGIRTGTESYPGAIQFRIPQTACAVLSSIGADPSGTESPAGEAVGGCFTSSMMSRLSMRDLVLCDEVVSMRVGSSSIKRAWGPVAAVKVIVLA